MIGLKLVVGVSDRRPGLALCVTFNVFQVREERIKEGGFGLFLLDRQLPELRLGGFDRLPDAEFRVFACLR